jgi:carbon-monoxide dehydrogenase iron sulfur subunit
MRRVILINYKKCTGCMICAIACSFKKTNTFNPARSRIKVVSQEEKGMSIPILCQHCEEPVCMACCPADAMSKDGKTGLVEIDRKVCINCKICRKVCPFGGPSLDANEKEVVICDHCGGSPVCVSACPNETLKYAEADGNHIMERRRGMGEIRKFIVNLGEA